MKQLTDFLKIPYVETSILSDKTPDKIFKICSRYLKLSNVFENMMEDGSINNEPINLTI